MIAIVHCTPQRHIMIRWRLYNCSPNLDRVTLYVGIKESMMSKAVNCVFSFVAVALLTSGTGCNKGTAPADSSTSATQDASAPASQQTTSTLPTEGNPGAEPGVEGQAAAPADVGEAMSAEVQAALASLSAEDRAAALKQKICPVSGGPLGSMGAPIKVAVAGHEVFICCEHCEQPLKDDAATHLAKIGLKPAEDGAVQ
jgi:hypothetical protein